MRDLAAGMALPCFSKDFLGLVALKGALAAGFSLSA
jgi:hypothetical protein